MSREDAENLFARWCAEARPGEIFSWWDISVASEFVFWAAEEGLISHAPDLPSSVREPTQ